jgi:O-glycosyl hydrolase
VLRQVGKGLCGGIADSQFHNPAVLGVGRKEFRVLKGLRGSRKPESDPASILASAALGQARLRVFSKLVYYLRALDGPAFRRPTPIPHQPKRSNSVNSFLSRFTNVLLLSSLLAIAGCSGGSTSVTVTVQTTPTITWATPSPISYGMALSATQLNATASVAGTFTYSPALGSVLTAGNQTLTATFTPTDTTDYKTATASVTLIVNKITPQVTWATPAAITYGTALSAAQLDASAGTLPGAFAYQPAAGIVPGAGAQPLTATFTPTDTTDYNTATATVTLQVNKATPTVSWGTPAAVVYGTALSSAQLDATASVPGTFVYTPASGTVPAIGTQTLSVAFTPTDSTDYNSATASVQLTVTKPTTTVSWAAPAAIAYGTALSAAQLDATANVPGTFVYTPASGTVLTAGAHTLSVAFTPTDTTDYASATATVQLTVNQAAPTITWATPAPVQVGTALGSAQLDATASVAGSFVYTPAAGTVLNTVGTTKLSAVFTPADAVDYTTASSSVSLVVSSNQAAGTAYVDFGTSNQTIRGFGGSTAWMPQMSTAQVNSLFGSASNQIGLSILRVRIDPSYTTGSAANWGTELANAQEAQALGASVIATPWTPPASMKSNNSTIGGTLNPSSYGAYANYLESFVTFMANGGVNLYGISMQNEPDAVVSYESCTWTGATMDTWVAQNASVLTAKLIMPESESFITGMSDPALNDPNAVGKIGIVAGHIYGVSPSYYTNAENLGKEVWETEHYLSPSGSQPAIADAIAAAQEIHNSLTVGQYNAYFWWWVADWNAGGGVTNYGLVDTNNNPTYYGNALAQFARFIRPGYVRSNATASPVNGVYVSAYKGNGHFVIVAINSNSAATSLPIVVQNQTVTSMTPYQTTASQTVAAQSPVSVTGNAFTYSLPAQSITTFVQ